MTFKDLRQASGLTQAQFSERFEIPKRTIEEWDRGTRTPPEYLLKLIEFKIRHENKTGSK